MLSLTTMGLPHCPFSSSYSNCLMKVDLDCPKRGTEIIKSESKIWVILLIPLFKRSFLFIFIIPILIKKSQKVK